jgi:hypothetical protein
VFTGAGSYASPRAFVAGLVPALWVGSAVLAAGALIALALPFADRAQVVEASRASDGSPEARREGRLLEAA